jgi:cytochrome c-type biogenesis protein CcmF
VGLGGSFEPVSRESLLLANNLLLAVAAAAVLLGTLYPLVIDALGGGKLSVGPPYFNAVFVPLMTPALFLMGVGPLARWRASPLPDLARRLRWAAAVSAVSAVVAPFVLGTWTPMVGLGLLLAVWIAASSGAGAIERLRLNRGPSLWRRVSAQGGSYWGMQLAHLGVAVFIAGVTVVGGFHTERDVRMTIGDHAEVGGYRFQLDHLGQMEGPNYLALVATLSVTRDGEPVATLRPQRRNYTVSRMPMTEVAIDRGFTRDLYVALGEPVGPEAFSVRIHHKPLVNWIWGGCLMMALGGMLAVADRRYRVRRQREAAVRAQAAGTPLPVTSERAA